MKHSIHLLISAVAITLATLLASTTHAEVMEEEFGKMPDDRPVKIFTLKNSAGTEARVTEYGAILVSLKTKDRVFWLWLARSWDGWRESLLIVKPATVVRWHRQGFKYYWAWKSRHKGGRPAVAPEVRNLIRRMSRANPLWGAPRIHGELLKGGIDLSQTTVAKYGDRR